MAISKDLEELIGRTDLKLKIHHPVQRYDYLEERCDTHEQKVITKILFGLDLTDSIDGWEQQCLYRLHEELLTYARSHHRFLQRRKPAKEHREGGRVFDNLFLEERLSDSEYRILHDASRWLEKIIFNKPLRQMLLSVVHNPMDFTKQSGYRYNKKSREELYDAIFAVSGIADLHYPPAALLVARNFCVRVVNNFPLTYILGEPIHDNFTKACKTLALIYRNLEVLRQEEYDFNCYRAAFFPTEEFAKISDAKTMRGLFPWLALDPGEITEAHFQALPDCLQLYKDNLPDSLDYREKSALEDIMESASKRERENGLIRAKYTDNEELGIPVDAEIVSAATQTVTVGRYKFREVTITKEDVENAKKYGVRGRESTFETIDEMNLVLCGSLVKELPVVMLVYKEIGRGGNRRVFWAKGIDNNDYAIKVYDPKKKADQLHEQEWENKGPAPESRTGLKLRHDNLIDYKLSGKCRYYGKEATFVMEPLVMDTNVEISLTLQELLAEGTLTETQKINIFKGIISCIAYLHNPSEHEGVVYVHGDVKLDNIMVQRNGNGGVHPYLVDSEKIRPAGECYTGKTTFSVLYAPPELESEEFYKADPRVDIFHLGIDLYAAFAEEFPFTNVSVQDFDKKRKDRQAKEGLTSAKKAAVNGDYMTEIEKNLSTAGVRQELQDIIVKCLHPDAEQRYSNAVELYKDFKQIS